MSDDPVKVDSKHYRVEFENDRVRVVRVRYGPHEKSVMHSHPEEVAIFLTDHHARFTSPAGAPQEIRARRGEVIWGEAGTHLPQNLEKRPFELILVEVKHEARGNARRRDRG